MPRGPLIIVSGPSGSGKSTLIRRALEDKRWPLRLAVSATTRPKREGEKEGVDYYFIPEAEFKAKLAAGEFLEHAVVHGQHYYGTPRSEVDPWREKGVGVILDIDVAGFDQVRKLYDDYLSIFIKLPSWEMYEERLKIRHSETPQTLARRLETARRELKRAGEYQRQIVNDDLETAVKEFEGILAEAFKGQSD